MRLIQLSSNKSSFKTVTFNRSGVSLIVGSRKDPANGTDDGRSYNGVGKSLLVEIIHFCLGSSTNKNFRQYLPDWEFTLRFEIGTTSYAVSRNTDKQGDLSLNGQTYKLKAFTELMGKLCFDLPDWGGAQLSFRTLLPRFIRRSKADYNDPRITASDREPYTILLRNLFLLGIDISLVENKYQLRTRQSELELFERNFKNDPFIREYYTGNKDASLQAKYLEEQIKKFEADLAKFAVAEDYYQIEREANDLTANLRTLKNKRAVVENALVNVQKSLETRTDIPREKLLVVYQEIEQAFRRETLKHLQEVENFHTQLLANRTARLGKERMKLEMERRDLEGEIHKLNSAVDSKLGYLSDKRALDQYAAVSAQVSELRAKFHKLQDYQHLLHKSREDAASIRIKLAEENIKTNAYLDETSYDRESRLAVFSSLAKRFYPDSPAGITLQNNLGDNKTRYDFDVRIEADGSDGINAVKLFCYDLALLIAQQNHTMAFVFHDSRLFSDIDPRQRAVLFQTASTISAHNELQYIATVNQDQLDALQAELSPSEFDELLGRSVLRLQDDGPESKLLGIQVDMHYQ
jgi:uncharacterized protein YydD (DUF2326 family)